jgi:hypothetical protein
MDARTASLLQGVFRRESRSLLHYASEAFPWATTEERDALAQLKKLIEQEQQAAAELARFLLRHRLALPPLGAYPDFTGINYVTLDHLLPLLAEEQRKNIARLEQDLAAMTDSEAKGQLEKLTTMKREHLAKLEAMAASHSATNATQPVAAGA